jgi:2-keto-3-deoxy-galactonokinase
MRFILVDWGTTRVRAYLVEGAAIAERVAAEEGVSALAKGQHAGVFQRLCGSWLRREPDLPVALVGMVGSREGWVEAPYAHCPAAPADVARATIAVDLGEGRSGHIVPGLSCAPAPGAVDVMRGEETLAFGAGVEDGLICLVGTHPKWSRCEEVASNASPPISPARCMRSCAITPWLDARRPSPRTRPASSSASPPPSATAAPAASGCCISSSARAPRP